MVSATQHHGMGWGGVGDDNVPCTCTHGRCYATSSYSSFLYLHTWSLLRNIMGWGGVGWGMITFLALAHMVAATQHQLSCTCTHGRCYATSWDGVGWGGVGDDNVPCTCTHGRCYATSTFLYLHTWSLLRSIMGWGGVGWGGVGDEVCKERCDSFVLTAGDNCAESLCAVSKKQLRRTNLNIAVVRDKIEHRYLLSSHFLNKAPGLARIMQALRCHKMKCMSGLVSPTDAFKKPLWQLWLTCSKKKRLTVMLLGPQIHCK